jgi:hypothetical protein
MSTTVGGIVITALSSAVLASAGDILTITGTGFPFITAGEWYKTDGLVAHYDGIFNVARNQPHDNTSEVWKDLSEKGNDVTISDTTQTGGWVGNGFQFPNGVYFKRAGGSVKDIPLGNANYSVELVWDSSHVANVNSGGFIGWGPSLKNSQANKTRFRDNNKRRLRHYWWGTQGSGGYDFDFDIPANRSARQLSITYDNMTVRKVYADAVYFAENTNRSKNTAGGYDLYVGHTGNGIGQTTGTNSEYANGNLIHAIRVYDRTLSEEDIKHNYRIDNARYNVVLPEIKVGGKLCGNLTIVSDTEISCTLPSGSGILPVTVSYGDAKNIQVGSVPYKSILLGGKKPASMFIDGKKVKAAWMNGYRIF